MDYIVLDMEWNQPMDEQRVITEPFLFDSEIVEFGAVKLNDRFEPIDEFKCYVRPRFFPALNRAVAKLTRIRAQDLERAPDFPTACRQFRDWCGDSCCLCTWSPTDILVLLDNMLLHGMDVTPAPLSCDLQRMFGQEIMGDGKQYALEYAIDSLGLPKERAHDALNDAKNTVQICGRMNLAAYIEEYYYRFVDYDRDRLDGLVDGLPFSSLAEAMQTERVTQVTCPYCGEAVPLRDWTHLRPAVQLGYGRCREGDEFLGRVRHRRQDQEQLFVSRLVYELNDDLWDVYQTALENDSSQDTTCAKKP